MQEKTTHVEIEAIRRDGGGTLEAINVISIEESNLYTEVRPDDESLQRLANLTEIIDVLEMADGRIEDIGKSLSSEEAASKQVKDAYKIDEVIDVY